MKDEMKDRLIGSAVIAGVGSEMLEIALQRKPSDEEVASFVTGWRAREELPLPPTPAANDKPTPDERASSTPYSAIEEAGWRPFSTAPKDGTTVLVAWFRERKGLYHNGPELVKWDKYHDGEGWVMLPWAPFERNKYVTGGFHDLPTHWAPVPVLPGVRD